MNEYYHANIHQLPIMIGIILKTTYEENLFYLLLNYEKAENL